MWFSWHNWCVTWFVDLINNFCEMTNWGIKLSIYSNLFNTYCTCYSINIPCSDILVGTIQVKLSSWENTYLWDVLSISTLMAHKDMHNSFFLHVYHVTWSCLYAHTFQEDCYLVIIILLHWELITVCLLFMCNVWSSVLNNLPTWGYLNTYLLNYS